MAGIALVLAGCSWLGPAEEYREESGRTVYRSADHSSPPDELPANKPNKVPGE